MSIKRQVIVPRFADRWRVATNLEEFSRGMGLIKERSNFNRFPVVGASRLMASCGFCPIVRVVDRQQLWPFGEDSIERVGVAISCCFADASGRGRVLRLTVGIHVRLLCSSCGDSRTESAGGFAVVCAIAGVSNGDAAGEIQMCFCWRFIPMST